MRDFRANNKDAAAAARSRELQALKLKRSLIPENFVSKASGIPVLAADYSQADARFKLATPCFCDCAVAACYGDPADWTREGLHDIMDIGYAIYKAIERPGEGPAFDLGTDDAARFKNTIRFGPFKIKFHFDVMEYGGIIKGYEGMSTAPGEYCVPLNVAIDRVFNDEGRSRALFWANGMWCCVLKLESSPGMVVLNTHNVDDTGKIFHGNKARAFYCDTTAKAVKVLTAGTLDKDEAEYLLVGMVVGSQGSGKNIKISHNPI